MKKLAVLSVLPCILLLVHCSGTDTIDCGAGQAVGDDGRCVDIPCVGGDIVNGVCVCPGDQVLDAGQCKDPADPCIGVTCDDGNLCTEDVCVDEGGEGVCPNNPVSCDDGNPCTEDGTCSADTGQCPEKTFTGIDTDCGNEQICDGAGNCVDCTKDEQCTDTNECTRDVCSDDKCANPNDDGAFCQILDPDDGRCLGGVCGEIPDVCRTVNCDDDEECTLNICQDRAGTATCLNPPDESTPPKQCSNDGDPGVCDGEGTCVGLCEGVNCDLGDKCTDSLNEPDYGECVVETGLCPPVESVLCDDGDDCTLDGCAEGSGCISIFTDGDDDGYSPGVCAMGNDCDDQLDDRNPGVTQWFRSQVACNGRGCSGPTTYDRNCKNGEELELPRLHIACSLERLVCTGDGWTFEVEGCGDSGDYTVCESVSDPRLRCVARSAVFRTQRCH